MTCEYEDHPGYGMTVAACEREVRLLEQGGGTGQWLLSVKADHQRPRREALAHLSRDWDARAAQLERTGSAAPAARAQVLRDCAAQLRALLGTA